MCKYFFAIFTNFYPFFHETNFPPILESTQSQQAAPKSDIALIRYPQNVKCPKPLIFTRNFGHLKLHFIERIRNVPILSLSRTDRNILYLAYGIVLTAYALSARHRSGCKDMQGLHQRLSCSPSGLPYSYGKRHVHRRPVRLP